MTDHDALVLRDSCTRTHARTYGPLWENASWRVMCVMGGWRPSATARPEDVLGPSEGDHPVCGSRASPRRKSGVRKISRGSVSTKQRGQKMKATVSAFELSSMIGVSTRTVRDLSARGIIARAGDGYPWPESNLRYTSHLRELASGRGGTAAASVATERARLLAAKATAAENENKLVSREFVPSNEVETEWSKRFEGIKRTLLALPSRIAWLDRSTRAELDREIRALLSDIADGRHG